MRAAITTLAILTAGALSLAFAEPPAAPVVPESRSNTAQNSTAEDSTGPSSAAQAASATAAANPPPTPSPSQPAPSKEKVATQSEQMAACLRSDKSFAECRAQSSREVPGPESDVSDPSALEHAAKQSLTAAETPAAAPAKRTQSASGEGVQEQLLRNQGYKLTIVHGEEKYCRREIPLGSRLATVMRCVTVPQAAAMAREGRETTERIQRNMPGCLSPAQGGCGH